MNTTDRLADEAEVRQGFWPKARKTLGKVPFSEDAVAAFYCATDSATPLPIQSAALATRPAESLAWPAVIADGRASYRFRSTGSSSQWAL